MPPNSAFPPRPRLVQSLRRNLLPPSRLYCRGLQSRARPDRLSFPQRNSLPWRPGPHKVRAPTAPKQRSNFSMSWLPFLADGAETSVRAAALQRQIDQNSIAFAGLGFGSCRRCCLSPINAGGYLVVDAATAVGRSPVQRCLSSGQFNGIAHPCLEPVSRDYARRPNQHSLTSDDA